MEGRRRAHWGLGEVKMGNGLILDWLAQSSLICILIDGERAGPEGANRVARVGRGGASEL